MNKITYLRKRSFTKYFISLLLFISGLYFLIYIHLFFGLVFSVIGFCMLIIEGSQIDFEQKMYRNIKSVFGIHIGKWQKLPTFDYVTVFKTIEGKKISVATASTVMRDEVYLINLFYEGSRYITFYKSEDKNDAFKMAIHFSRILNLRILDSTELQSVWVE